MKLLIDIPEHIYEHAKESTEDSRDEFDAMRAIANGSQQESCSEFPNTCGDAISRQAAINLMRGLTRWCVKSEDGKFNNVGLLYDDVMFGIDRLPSVNPQQKYEDVAKAFQLGMALGFGEKHDEMDKVIEEIKKVVTPQQRTGRWIQKEEEDEAEPFIIWECSECHCVDEDGKPSYKYCPQCGAKMEVEDAD